jgi:hypothetical protein
MIRLIFFFVFTFPLFAQDIRLQEHQTATKVFKDLHFFYKGRGMAITPDLIKLYEEMGKRGVGTSELGPIYQR